MIRGEFIKVGDLHKTYGWMSAWVPGTDLKCLVQEDTLIVLLEVNPGLAGCRVWDLRNNCIVAVNYDSIIRMSRVYVTAT
jgi:hypothetical protein